jgi:hypothetical protein
MLFKEMIAVYSEKHTKPINTKYSIIDCQDTWNIYLPLDFEGYSLFSRSELTIFLFTK